MGCSSCGSMGHFGSYVQPNQAQFFQNTGPMKSAPNETAGMRSPAIQGLGDLFNFTPGATDWIAGVPNGFITVGIGVILLVTLMKR